ncbi:MAG: hypothetical protein Q8K75_11905 [Chlamydiales bacterium]|nr:hypothetical protein [Chlamydiales bacterium]
MLQYLTMLLTVLHFCFMPYNAQAEPSQEEKVTALMFTPPEGWLSANPKNLSPRVKAMVIGSGSATYPPSINLTLEDYKGSLKEYLKIVKAINDSQNAEWKNLGTIHTEAGKGSLSQVDMETNWGTVRLMHVIIVKDGQAYIMTAAALKDEFPRYYSDFFKSMQSLRFGEIAPEQLTANLYESTVRTQRK